MMKEHRSMDAQQSGAATETNAPESCVDFGSNSALAGLLGQTDGQGESAGEGLAERSDEEEQDNDGDGDEEKEESEPAGSSSEDTGDAQSAGSTDGADSLAVTSPDVGSTRGDAAFAVPQTSPAQQEQVGVQTPARRATSAKKTRRTKTRRPGSAKASGGSRRRRSRRAYRRARRSAKAMRRRLRSDAKKVYENAKDNGLGSEADAPWKVFRKRLSKRWRSYKSRARKTWRAFKRWLKENPEASVGDCVAEIQRRMSDLRRELKASIDSYLASLQRALLELYAKAHRRDSLADLPEGASLTDDQRALIEQIFDETPDAQLDILEMCFKKRFGVTLTTDGEANWTADHLRVVWEQLLALPEQDVSENTFLKVFKATSGGGGTWNSGTGQVAIGQDVSDESMSSTVRHEIGHAVHTLLGSTVDNWLKDDIGIYSMSFEDMITDLGGYPASYTDSGGAVQTFSTTQQKKVVTMLDRYTGGGQWGPSQSNVWEDDSGKAIWEAMPDAVRGIVEKSPKNWYNSYKSFQTGPKGRYALNYYYGEPYYMSDEAANLVAATGRTYTLMSHKEFFADCYSEFFREPDSSNWGGRLPADVQTWFNTNIVDRDGGAVTA